MKTKTGLIITQKEGWSPKSTQYRTDGTIFELFEKIDKDSIDSMQEFFSTHTNIEVDDDYDCGSYYCNCRHSFMQGYQGWRSATEEEIVLIKIEEEQQEIKRAKARADAKKRRQKEKIDQDKAFQKRLEDAEQLLKKHGKI